MADQKSAQQPTGGNGGNRPQQPAQGEPQRSQQQGLERGAQGQLSRQRGQSLLGVDPFSLLAVSPFALLRRFSEEMDQMLSPAGFGGFAPQIDVTRKENELIVRADLPGVDKKDINIEIQGGMLLLEGERRSEREQRGEGGVYRSERSYGMFRRQIPLPEDVQEDAVKANFDNGVLEIVIPFARQRSAGKRIEVQGGGSRST